MIRQVWLSIAYCIHQLTIPCIPWKIGLKNKNHMTPNTKPIFKDLFRSKLVWPAIGSILFSAYQCGGNTQNGLFKKNSRIEYACPPIYEQTHTTQTEEDPSPVNKPSNDTPAQNLSNPDNILSENQDSASDGVAGGNLLDQIQQGKHKLKHVTTNEKKDLKSDDPLLKVFQDAFNNHEEKHGKDTRMEQKNSNIDHGYDEDEWK